MKPHSCSKIFSRHCKKYEIFYFEPSDGKLYIKITENTAARETILFLTQSVHNFIDHGGAIIVAFVWFGMFYFVTPISTC